MRRHETNEYEQYSVIPSELMNQIMASEVNDFMRMKFPEVMRKHMPPYINKFHHKNYQQVLR